MTSGRSLKLQWSSAAEGERFNDTEHKRVDYPKASAIGG